MKICKDFIKILHRHVSYDYLIAGGPHPSILPIETMKEIPELDYIIYGEGEMVFKELLDCLNNTGNCETIHGIVFRKDNEIIKNPSQKLIENLDILPFPKWELSRPFINRMKSQENDQDHHFSLYNLKIFEKKYGLLFPKEINELPILSQRGCPYQCIFCCKILGSKVRTRSIDNIIAEIKYNSTKSKVNRLNFWDENFTQNKKFVIEFCQRFINEGFHNKFTWSCFSRFDTIDDEILYWMKKANCFLIMYGLESGNNQILKIIKKNINLEKAREVIYLTKKHHILSQVTIIYGHPYESKRMMNESLEFILDIKPDIPIFFSLVAFPNTRLFELVQQKKGGLINQTSDWSKMSIENMFKSPIEYKNHPRWYLFFFVYYSYLRFIFMPERICNFFNYISPSEMKILFISFIRKIKR